MMIRCPHCNAVYTDENAVCPVCGKAPVQDFPASGAPEAAQTQAPQEYSAGGAYCPPQESVYGAQQTGVYAPPPMGPYAPGGSQISAADRFRLELQTVQTLGILSICFAASIQIAGVILGIIGLLKGNRLRMQAAHPLAQEEIRRARRLCTIGIIIAAAQAVLVIVYAIYIFLFAFRYGFNSILDEETFLSLLTGI